ncbi:hypothetical protein AAG570_002480 [Ranatra chinensis]|uniref:L27 domain-containing protein n=1 Tax=Ranatra chinensis TaxID=642074 RepID=A0ABD0Y7P5_9HEMI
MVVELYSEAHRALELLEDYHSKLTKPQDKQLRLAIERVIRIFKSRLFQALLGGFVTMYKTATNFGPDLRAVLSSALCPLPQWTGGRRSREMRSLLPSSNYHP